MAIQRPFKYTLLLILLVIPLIIFGSILVLDSERDEKLLKVQDFVLQNIGNVLGSRINPGKGSRISVKKTGPISPWSWQASLQNCTEKTRDSNFIPFNNERMAKWTITDAGIADLQREWKSHIDAYVDQPTPENGTRTTRGYLYTARSKNVQILQLSLKSLRRFTNDSVEVWHDDDLHSNYISSLESDFPPLKVFNLKDFNIPHLEAIDDGRKYQVKGAAIIHTKLDKVLLLDSDNVPLVEPSFLFDSPAFTETGAVFWPDYWKTLPDNPIWKIMDLECADEFEQESGQLLVDKAFPGVNRALHLAFFLQTRSSTYYSYLLGDKDTFRHAFRSLNQPYHMIRANVNPVSSPQEIEFSGHSMVSYSLAPSRYILILILYIAAIRAILGRKRVWTSSRRMERPRSSRTLIYALQYPQVRNL